MSIQTELDYQLRRWGAKLGFKGLTAGVTSAFSAIAALSSFTPWLGIAGTGLGAAFGALQEQQELGREEERLMECYSKEIANILGKPVKDVTIQDLYTVANGDLALGVDPNETLREHLDYAARKRWVRIGVTAGLAAATLGAAFLVLPAMVGIGAGLALPGIAFTIAGIAANFVGGRILEKIGDHLAGVHEPDTHQTIRALQRAQGVGTKLSEEQVFAAYVVADKELGKEIQQAFGKPYIQLEPQAKRRAAQRFGHVYGLEAMTDRVNSGQYNVRELAFAVQGQSSGLEYVDLRPIQKGTVIANEAKDKFMDATADLRHNAADKLGDYKDRAILAGEELRHKGSEALQRILHRGPQEGGIRFADSLSQSTAPQRSRT